MSATDAILESLRQRAEYWRRMSKRSGVGTGTAEALAFVDALEATLDAIAIVRGQSQRHDPCREIATGCVGEPEEFSETDEQGRRIDL